MKWIILLILSLFIIIILILLTKLKVHVSYRHIEDNDNLIIKCTAWYGLFRYTVKVPLVQLDIDSTSIKVQEKTGRNALDKEETKRYTASDFKRNLEEVKDIVTHVFGLHHIVRNFLRKVRVKTFEWRSHIGIGDAAYTGMIVGGLWALKSSIIGLFTNYLDFKVKPTYTITPDFQQLRAEAYLSCIFQFRVGQAMWAGIKMIRFWRGNIAKAPKMLMNQVKKQ